jgi:tRNA (guanine-N7-)-methyltransferase
MTDSGSRRPIRSYVLRAGRMTDSQKRAFEQHWQTHGLEYAGGVLDIDAAFGRAGPCVLEVGFGMGGSLLEMAQAMSATNFIGVEVHPPGVGRLLHAMNQNAVDNIRIYRHDAVEVLRDCIPEASLDAVHIYFPDPWQKKRHHKRRLVQPDFVALVQSRLKAGGVLHLATDWENYAEQMMEILSVAEGLSNTCGEGQFAPRPAHRPPTKFEQRGERLGHGVWDLVFRKDEE